MYDELCEMKRGVVMAERESRLPDIALLLLRVGAGVFLIMNHGWGKLVGAYGNVFQGQEWGFISFVASIGFPLARFFALSAAAAEFFGSLLLILGLFTRFGSALVAIVMAVAVYFHLTQDMGIEMAGLYLLIAVLYMFVSPGRYSIDELIASRSRQPSATTVAEQAA